MTTAPMGSLAHNNGNMANLGSEMAIGPQAANKFNQYRANVGDDKGHLRIEGNGRAEVASNQHGMQTQEINFPNTMEDQVTTKKQKVKKSKRNKGESTKPDQKLRNGIEQKAETQTVILN